SDVASIFKQFLQFIQNQFHTLVKCVQSDWGGEYRSLVSLFNSLGVSFRHPCPHTHQQNGRAERKHLHIVEMGLTLLAHAKMPLKFWWDSFQTSVYTINRLPTPVLNHFSPFQSLFNSSPDFSFLKPF
ncbi:Uncharacterized mitochondrial protein AtMg00710, partial [Striga hermonthica]